jgi:DNA-binding LacI/PurR family transcriptional regulator
VPDDFSIIGFDNIHIAEVAIPPLTTVEMSRLDLARAAVTALRKQVELVGDSPKKGEFCVRTNLVVRESTNFPRGTVIPIDKNNVPTGRNPGRGNI